MVERGRCPFSTELCSKGASGPCCDMTMGFEAQSYVSLKM